MASWRALAASENRGRSTQQTGSRAPSCPPSGPARPAPLDPARRRRFLIRLRRALAARKASPQRPDASHSQIQRSPWAPNPAQPLTNAASVGGWSGPRPLLGVWAYPAFQVSPGLLTTFLIIAYYCISLRHYYTIISCYCQVYNVITRSIISQILINV